MVKPTALVTGGSRGIGRAVSVYLAHTGWDLTICGRDAVRLADAATELEMIGATVNVVAGDLADESGTAAAVASHARSYGHLNALVLSAGVGSAGALDDYPLRRLDKQLAVNIRAPFAMISQALPLLRAGVLALPRRGGRIVALTSLEGVHPEAGLAAYGATKAALISLIRSVNIEEAVNGIAASAISPGFVDTDMSAWTADTIPTDTMIWVSDVVKAVDLVLSVSPNAVLPHLVMNRARGGAYHA